MKHDFNNSIASIYLSLSRTHAYIYIYSIYVLFEISTLQTYKFLRSPARITKEITLKRYRKRSNIWALNRGMNTILWTKPNSLEALHIDTCYFILLTQTLIATKFQWTEMSPGYQCTKYCVTRKNNIWRSNLQKFMKS